MSDDKNTENKTAHYHRQKAGDNETSHTNTHSYNHSFCTCCGTSLPTQNHAHKHAEINFPQLNGSHDGSAVYRYECTEESNTMVMNYGECVCVCVLTLHFLGTHLQLWLEMMLFEALLMDDDGWQLCVMPSFHVHSFVWWFYYAFNVLLIFKVELPSPLVFPSGIDVGVGGGVSDIGHC